MYSVKVGGGGPKTFFTPPVTQYGQILYFFDFYSSNGVNDITQVPQLSDYLRFFKPKRFTLKSFKSLFFVCRDLVLTAYKTSDAAARGVDPVMQVNLKGCEVTPEVNLSQHKYQVKLEIPSAEGMSEMWLRFDTVSHPSIPTWGVTNAYIRSMVVGEILTVYLSAVMDILSC